MGTPQSHSAVPLIRRGAACVLKILFGSSVQEYFTMRDDEKAFLMLSCFSLAHNNFSFHVVGMGCGSL